MRKRYLSKKSFTYEIYALTSKAAHKVFQQRGASSWLSSRIFSGGESIAMQISFVMLIFLLFSDQILGFTGGGRKCVEESQSSIRSFKGVFPSS